jgi:hypothetical protein
MHFITADSPSELPTNSPLYSGVKPCIGNPQSSLERKCPLKGHTQIRQGGLLSRPRILSRLSWRGTSRPSEEYSLILFRSVRTETPSRRADMVLFPRVCARVSKIRSRSTSLMGEPTSHRARRRRDELEIGALGDRRSIARLYKQCPLAPHQGTTRWLIIH